MISRALFAALALPLFLFSCRAATFDPLAGPGDPSLRLDAALGRFAEEQREAQAVLEDPEAQPDARAEARRALGAAEGRLRGELRLLAIDFPRHGPVQRSAGAVLYAASEFVEAERHLDAALAANSSDTSAAILRAQLAYDTGNTPLARKLVRSHLALRPDHPELWELDALLALEAGDADGAETRLARAERLGAPGWRLAFNRGLIAEARDEPETAAGHYHTALELRPDHLPSARRLRAMQSGG